MDWNKSLKWISGSVHCKSFSAKDPWKATSKKTHLPVCYLRITLKGILYPEVYSRSNQTGNKLTNPQVNNQMHIPRPPVRAPSLPTSTRVSKSASSGNIGRLHCRTAKRRSSSSLVRLAIVSLPATLQLVLPAWCPILQQSNKGTGFFHQFDDIGV